MQRGLWARAEIEDDPTKPVSGTRSEAIGKSSTIRPNVRPRLLIRAIGEGRGPAGIRGRRARQDVRSRTLSAPILERELGCNEFNSLGLATIFEDIDLI